MALSRRTFLVSAGAAGAAAWLSACSSGSGSSDGTVTTWNGFADNDQATYYRQHFIDAYPGPGKVTMVIKPTNNLARLTQTALAAGSGPDLVGTAGPSTDVTEYVKAGYLVDLESAAKKFQWDQKFASWALAASRLDGKLRTLPTSYESLVAYYNPATLDKLGTKAPTTLDEFVAFNTEAKSAGMIPIAAGNSDWKGANEWHVTMALNHIAGPEAVYSALKGTTKWTDPVFVDAITQLADWFKKGWYGGDVQSYFTTKFPTVYKQLADGDAAAMVSGTWEFSNLGPYFGTKAGNSATWVWEQLPSLRSEVPKTVFALGIGASVGLNAHSKNLDDAAAFLNWSMTDKATIVASVVDQNFQPTPIKLTAADFGAKADPRTVKLYSELSGATTIGYTTWTFFPQQTETYLIDYWDNVITGKLSPADYCAGIQQKFAPELAAGRVPTAPKPGGAAS